MTTWLVLDVSCLAYRAFHSLPQMTWQEAEVEVTFGILKSIDSWQTVHYTKQLVWCFDGGCDRRVEISPEYKANRAKHLREMEPEERKSRRSLKRQIYRLRTKHLPSVGYPNVLWQEGYEADDLMAAVCERTDRKDTVVLVSSDHDLYQLLSDRVIMFNPHKQKAVTAKSFERQYGIGPSMWADVKAIAGCPGDGVAGVKGVGEKVAVDFLTGRLKQTSKRFQEIVKANDLWRKNLELVRLPFYGVREFELEVDKHPEKRWERLVKSLGMKSLMRRARG